MSIVIKKSGPIEPIVWKKGGQLQKKRLRENVDIERHLAYYDRGPGPAGFLLPTLVGRKGHDPTHQTGPEYTLRPYLQGSFQFQGLSGPGTGKYKIPNNVTHFGQFYPNGKSFGRKHTFGEKTWQVGPGTYNLPHPDVYLYKNPKSILTSVRCLKPPYKSDGMYLLGPMIGPKVIGRTSAQEVSLKGNRKEKKNVIERSPGVGAYSIPDAKPSPAWTIRGRFRNPLPDDKLGPKYLLPPIKTGPAWKLGRKHNEFTGILRTPCDIVNYKLLDRLQ